MPAYDAAEWIHDAIGSIQSQTLADWECIVVDDASRDATAELAGSVTDPRIRVIRHAMHAGPAAARNTGIREARGEYIQMHDADDLVEPRKLEEQARVLDEHPELDVVYGDARYFDDGDLRSLRRGLTSDDDWMPRLSGGRDVMLPAFLRDNLFPTPAVLVRKRVFETLGLLDETLELHEDYELFLRWADAGVQFQYAGLPATGVLIRCHPSSSSRNRVRMFETKLQVWAQIAPRLDRNLRKITRASRAWTLMRLAREDIERSRKRAVIRLAHAAVLHPDARARARLAARAVAASVFLWPRE
jgi:glycosyltransferase involved in cell wall biosynthesis